MMKILSVLLVLFICLSASTIQAQETFVKVLDHQDLREAWQIEKYNNRIYIYIAAIINNREAGAVKEINENGEVLWSKDLPWLDGSFNTMMIHNDTITVVGNEDVTQESFFVHHMTLDGDSITTYNYDDEFSRIFIQKVTMFNDQIIVAGDGILNDSMSALLYVINKDGSLDTLIQSAKSNERAIIWDALVDQQNRLNVFIETSEAFVVGRSTIVKNMTLTTTRCSPISQILKMIKMIYHWPQS